MCTPMEIPSVEKVFAVAELTEIILGFATLGRKLNQALELRQVCKSWKRALFPVLVSTKKMLLVDVGCPKQIRRFSETIPWNCDLPICVKISKSTWTLDQLRFLLTYANNFVAIEFTSMPVFDVEETERQFATMDMTFPKLRSISITPPSEGGNITPCPLTNFVINRIQNCATRVPLNVMCGDEFTPSAKTSRIPVRMDNFTFMHNTWNDDAGKLFMESTTRLSSLAIHVNQVVNEDKDNSIDTAVNNFAKSLETLVLSVTSTDVQQIELSNLSKLKSLEIRNVPLKSDSKKRMPLLENLCLMGPAEVVLENLTALTNQSKCNPNLNRLTLQAGALDEQQPLFFVERFTWAMLQAIESAPSLKILDWRQMHMQVANVVLPVMFRTLRSLKKLTLDIFITSDLMSCDLTHLLTGIASRNVPKNSNDWSRVLNRSNRSINMLQCLEEFEISNPHTSTEELIVSPLMFKAFSRIASLKTLTFKGYLKIDYEAAKGWLDESPFRKLQDLTQSNLPQ